MARVKCPHCFHVNPDQQENCQKCGTKLPKISIEARSAINDPPPGKSQFQFRRGQVIAGRYTVLNLIGQGGMGCIYKVHDNTLGEDVALKTLLPQFLQDKIVLERFYNEAKIARRLAHPNIVRVHDIGEDGKILYISMEYLQGMSLREILDNLGAGERLPISETLRIFDQLCAALEYAHQFTVHRDIKPENVMLGQDRNVRLMDFGISKLMANTRLTNASIVMGTPFYMSPEQIRNSRDVDARADIYSVGVMLYEILTGTVPTGVPKPASQVTKDVPPALDKIVARCVEPDPRDRYQSATELRQAFQPVRQHIKSGVSTSKTSLIARTTSGYSLRKIAGAALVVVIVVLALWGLAEAERKRKALADAPVPVPAATESTAAAVPAFADYAAIVDEIRPAAEDRATAGLNDALREARALWDAALAENDSGNEDRAIAAARKALQCYIAPFMRRDGMVFIPPGPVYLGGTSVDVPGFFIDDHEVTVGDYRRFLQDEHLWTLPPEYENVGDVNDIPIGNVTCMDAMAYAAWNKAQLPTEAQWARAAYAGDAASDYPWNETAARQPEDDSTESEETPLCRARFDDSEFVYPGRVMQFETDKSRFGCYDMVGNVSEWTCSTEPPLAEGLLPDFGSTVVVRGGNSNEPLRPWTSRVTVPYESKAITLGLRCVVPVPSDPDAARAVFQIAQSATP